MKIRYPVIAAIIAFTAMLILKPLKMTELGFEIYNIIANILLVLFFVCLGLIVYLVIRNTFRAITGKKDR